ncbi:MAG: hypothetical protein AAF950_14180 [Pseudomonadota bacterium]
MVRHLTLALAAYAIMGPCSFAEISRDPLNLIGVLDVSGRYSGEPMPALGVPNDWFVAAWGEEEASPKLYTVGQRVSSSGVATDMAEQSIALSDFLMVETEYEQPHIAVFEKRGSWLEVRVNQLPIWIGMSAEDEFIPYTALISNGLNYLTASTISFADTPGGPMSAFPFSSTMQGIESPTESWGPDITVLDIHPSDAREDWIKIRVTDLPHCKPSPKQGEAVIFEGWIRSHRPDGLVSIWFHSRGC